MPDQPPYAPASSPAPSSETPQPGHGSDASRTGDLSTGGLTGSPDSAALLGQILHRLQRMEGGLSQHEQLLQRIQAEHGRFETAGPQTGGASSPANELQRLIGSLTLERDRANKVVAEAQSQIGQYQQELVAVRKQNSQLQARITEREQQLATLRDTATKDREQLKGLQSEAQRQIQHRQQQLRSVQSQLAAAQSQIVQRQQQISELRNELEKAAGQFELLSAEWSQRAAQEPSSPAPDRTFSRLARWAVAAALVASFASAGLTGWLYERSRASAVHTVSGTVLMPGLSGQQLESLSQMAASQHGLQASADPRLGTVELVLHSSNAEAAAAQLDKVARAMLARVPPVGGATTAPAATPEGQRIAEQIAILDRQLSTASRPAPLKASADDLAGRWQQLIGQRQAVAESLDQLARQLEAKPTQTAPEIPPDQIAQAEAADQRLQAEREALRQREGQLGSRLRVTIDAAALQFESLQQALTAADSQLDQKLKEDQPEQVIAQLETIRDSLATWAQAVSTLDAGWQQQGRLIGSAGGDLLAVQSNLEKSARTFLNEIADADTAFTQAIENIGQGQDQTTKRLVLRNALVKQLAPVTGAQQAVSNAARGVILTENLELTAIVQRLDALRTEIEQRRTQIATAIRQDHLARQQQEQARQLADARRRHQVLAQGAARIDSSLMDLGARVTRDAADRAEQARRLAGQLALLQQQAAELKQMIKLHDTFAGQVAAQPPPPAPGYLPARVLASTTAGPSLTQALLLGSTPALACAAFIIIASMVISSRRSRQTIEDYARTLKETARRAGLAETDELPAPTTPDPSIPAERPSE